MSEVFVLRLSGEKWYVGSSKTLDQYLASIIEGEGPVWTQMYPPIGNVEHFVAERESVPTEDVELVKDAKVKIYMRRFGIENVRGGKFVRATLSQAHRNEISELLGRADKACVHRGKKTQLAGSCPNAATALPNMCSRCGRPGHSVAKCYARKHADGSFLGDAPLVVLSTDHRHGDDDEQHHEATVVAKGGQAFIYTD